MTDKQIIIDRVDVSECENLMQGIVPFGCMEDRKTCSCMNNPNCYYKQLKRLEFKLKVTEADYEASEQECEELKKNVEHWKMEHNEAKAKAEWTYDLVKKRLGQQLDQLKVENERLIDSLGIANKYVNKYHHTLQEIMVITKELLEKGLEPQSVEHQLKLKGKRELASIILDIITKAESEG